MGDTVISEELRTRVRSIVAEVLEIDTAELTDDSSFADDFGADSLLTIEMLARFEQNLGVKVPQDDTTELDNLPAAYALVGRFSTADNGVPEAASV